MAHALDVILVVDIESTTWLDRRPPPGEEAEIIEVGVCVLDLASLERRERHSKLVRPERSRVSAFCTELTTLTQDQVDGGESFHDVCEWIARELGARERAWASWGDYDRRMFERQCLARGTRYPFGPTHLNVKNLVSMAEGWTEELGMDAALERLGLPLEGTHHRGVDDAWNIAALLARVLRTARSPS